MRIVSKTRWARRWALLRTGGKIGMVVVLGFLGGCGVESGTEPLIPAGPGFLLANCEMAVDCGGADPSIKPLGGIRCREGTIFPNCAAILEPGM